VALTESFQSTVIVEILNQVDQVTNGMVFNGYAALAASLKTPLMMIFTIYVAFIGWSILQGWSKLTVGQATKHVLKIAIVLALVTEWSVFARYLYNVFTNAPNELSALVMQSIGGGSGEGVNSALQTLFDQSMHLGMEVWAKGGFWKGIGMWLFGALIWAFAIILVTVALIIFVVSKFSLSILLVLAPVFVPFLLWQSTKGIFDGWIKSSLGFAFVPLFASAALILGNAIMRHGVSQLQKIAATGTLKPESIVVVMICSIVSTLLLLISPLIAARISGGININAVGSTLRMSGASALSDLAAKGATSGMAMGAGLAGKGAGLLGKGALMGGRGAAFLSRQIGKGMMFGAKATYRRMLRK
jgi:type IV secretion system protein VirB6